MRRSLFHYLQVYDQFFPWFVPMQEPVKPVPTLQEIDDMELKEYRDCLTLEENILKGMGLWTAPPEIDDI